MKANRAANWPLAKDDGDTIWMGAIDGSGLAVSFIQSLYWEYGSGVVLPKTGILWQNRGMAFLARPQGAEPVATWTPAFPHAQHAAGGLR